MDYGIAISRLPSKPLGSVKRDSIIETIKTRLSKKAYNDDPSLLKKNRNTLKKLRNNIKFSYSKATQKNLIRRRFDEVNRLAQAFGVEPNAIPEEKESDVPTSTAASVAASTFSFGAPGPASVALPVPATLVPAAPALELSPENVATLADLQSQIQAIDYSMNARAKNEERLSGDIVIEQNEVIDKAAQKDVDIRIEKLGFREKSDTSEPEKVFVKTDSRPDGNCLPSSIYLAAKERPEVAEILSGLDLPMENQTNFIKAFRELLAGSVRAGSLPSESPGEDIYTRARDLLVSKQTNSYNRLKESFTPESRDALKVIEKNPNDREGFLKAYAKFLEKNGNWMTHNEYTLINQILSSLNLVIFSFSHLKQIPAHLSKKVNGAHVLYLYNPDQAHYVYFSFTVPKVQEEAALNNLKEYIKEIASKRLLLEVRSEKAGLASQKQRLQAEVQRIERKTRAESPPPGKMPYWMTKSLHSSPLSATTLGLQKNKPTIKGSPASSVISTVNKTRYDPETGEVFKGTNDQWVARLKAVLELAQLQVKKTLIF